MYTVAQTHGTDSAFTKLSNSIGGGLQKLIYFEEVEIPNRFFQEAADVDPGIEGFHP